MAHCSSVDDSGIIGTPNDYSCRLAVSAIGSETGFAGGIVSVIAIVSAIVLDPIPIPDEPT